MLRKMMVVSLLLVAVSLPALWQQAVELYLGSRAYDRYRVEELHGDGASINGRRVVVTPKSVTIEGRRYSRLPDSDLALLLLRNKKSNESSVIVAERISTDAVSGQTVAFHPDSWRYRLLGVSDAGVSIHDEFSFEQRGDRLERVMLARFVSPQSIGFRSQATAGYPTLLYPVLYPWMTGTMGTVLLILSVVMMGLRRRLK